MPCHPICPPWRAPQSVAWLHACGVCVSVPGQGRCQHWARREIGGLGIRAHRTLASSPGPPLAQSVVLETGPQPSPAPVLPPLHPPLQISRGLPTTEAAKQGEHVPTVEWGGGWAWTLDLYSLSSPTLNRRAAQAVALTSPPVLSQCCSLLTSPLLPAHHWHVCRLFLLVLVLLARSPSVKLLLCVGVEALTPSSRHAIF